MTEQIINVERVEHIINLFGSFDENIKLLEREYGVTVFFDLLPRIMMPEELKRRVLDLYHCGAERLSFWDTYSRAPARLCWSMLRRVGHKEELENWDSGEGQWYKIYRILRYDHMDVTRYMPAWGG